MNAPSSRDLVFCTKNSFMQQLLPLVGDPRWHVALIVEGDDGELHLGELSGRNQFVSRPLDRALEFYDRVAVGRANSSPHVVDQAKHPSMTCPAFVFKMLVRTGQPFDVALVDTRIDPSPKPSTGSACARPRHRWAWRRPLNSITRAWKLPCHRRLSINCCRSPSVKPPSQAATDLSGDRPPQSAAGLRGHGGLRASTAQILRAARIDAALVDDYAKALTLSLRRTPPPDDQGNGGGPAFVNRLHTAEHTADAKATAAT